MTTAPPRPPPPIADAPADISRRGGLLLLAAALLLGGLLRLPGLGDAPPGFYHDEAYYALDAAAILEGARPVFLEANNGRQALFSYSMAPLIAWLGPTVEAARLTAALWGLAFLPVAWLLVAEALHGRPWRRLAAGLTALLVAGLFWHLLFSRFGLRVSTFPFALGLLAWLTLLALRRQAWWAWLAAGLAMGLGFHTYLPGYALPLVLIAVVLPIGLVRRQAGRHLRGLAIALAGWLLVAAPLLVYFALDPGQLLARPGQVSLAAATTSLPELGAALLENSGRYLGLYVTAGDRNWRYNLAGEPLLDLVTIGLVLLGLAGFALGTVRRSASWLAAVLFVAMLAPGVLTYEGAPNALRVFGTLVPLVVVCGAGFALAARLLHRLAGRRGALLATAAGLAAVAVVAGSTGWRYFMVYAANPATAVAFDADVALLARRLAADPVPAVVAGVTADNRPIVRYLAPGAYSAVEWLDDLAVLDLARLAPGSRLAFARSLAPLATAVSRPQGTMPWVSSDGRLVELAAATPPDVPPLARFADGSALQDLVIGGLDPGGAVAAGWTWRPAPDRPVFAFLRLTDEQDREWVARIAQLPAAGESSAFAYAQAYFDPVLPPGRYRLWLGFSDRDLVPDRLLEAPDERRDGPWLLVGSVPVAADSFPQTGGPLATPRPLDGRPVGGVAVAGVDLGASTPREASTLPLALLLRTAGARTTPELRLQLWGDDGLLAEQAYTPFGGAFAPADWVAGIVYKDLLAVTLPRRVDRGPLTLALAAPGERRGRELARFPVAQRERQLTSPANPGRPIGVAFGEGVRLTGAELAGSNSTTVSARDRLPVRLVWEATGEPPARLRSFVHVRDASGVTRAQTDREPLGGEAPTLSWVRGQWVDDRFEVDISQLPPGDYSVVVGMSDLTRGGRVPLAGANADNTLPLGTLRVTP